MGRITDIIVDAIPTNFTGTVGDYHLYSNLIRFMTKWECTGPLRILHNNLAYGARQSNAIALAVFVIGASTDNTDLCRIAATKADASDSWWMPSKFPGWVWVHCPPPYLAALVKSWALHVPKTTAGTLDNGLVSFLDTTKRADWSS
jgi:hypothetical protein